MNTSQTTMSAGGVGGSGIRARKPPPPPPPRKSTTTNTSSTSSASINRPTAATASSGTGLGIGTSNTAATATFKVPNDRSKTAGGATTSTATRLPVMSSASTSSSSPVISRMKRPVGNYYNSGPSSASAATATTLTNSSSHSQSQSTWDWSAPAPAPAPATMATTSTTTPNSWAAPTAMSSSASTNSWAAPSPYNNNNNQFQQQQQQSQPTNDDDWYKEDDDAGGTGGTFVGAQPTTITTSSFYGHNSGSNSQLLQPQQQPQPLMMNSNLNNSFSGGMMMDTTPTAGTAAAAPKFSTFMPQILQPTTTDAYAIDSNNTTDTEDDYPLLEELGINLEHIYTKTKAVILPSTRLGGGMKSIQEHAHDNPEYILQDADLAGPIAYCLLLGAEMVLAGKLQFGYIYGFGVFGCLSMTLIVNLITPQGDAISIWTVSSILGYSLIPVNVLAALKLLIMNSLLQLNFLGRTLGLLTVLWSTVASTRLLELGCGLQDQRYLIAYPIALLYSAFVLITIF